MSFLPVRAALEIYPYQYEHEPKNIHRLIVGRVDAADAKNICQKLQEGRRNNHPTIALSMEKGLSNVGTESDTEENDKEICGWKTRAKGPLGCFLIFENWRPGQSVVVIPRGKVATRDLPLHLAMARFNP